MEELKIELLNYLPKLIKGIREMAQYFHEGNNQKALELLSQVIEGVDWLSRAFAAQAGVQLEKIPMLNSLLSQANDAIERKDYILTADIFEYEIVDVLTKIFDDISKVNYN